MNRECPKCLLQLPLTTFFKDKTHANGYMSRCKNCLREQKRGNALYHQKARRERKKFPFKALARSAVHSAVARGLLARLEICEICRQQGKTHAHHNDYSKPLVVRWLCTKCHYAVHHPQAVAV